MPARGLVARFSLKALLADERGATAVEYGLIVSCIFLAIVGGLSLFATNENVMYNWKISTSVAKSDALASTLPVAERKPRR